MSTLSYTKTGKLGSTAAAIIRAANKPVLILQKRHNLNHPPVAVYDGSQKSVFGVNISSDIARRYDSKLTVIDVSDAFSSTEDSRSALDKLDAKTNIVTLEKPDMGRFLFMVNKLQGGLLILPKNKRFTRRNAMEHILICADCPVLLAN